MRLVSGSLASFLVLSISLLFVPQFGHLGHFHSFALALAFPLLPGALLVPAFARRDTRRVLDALPPLWLAFTALGLAPVLLSEALVGGCNDPLGLADYFLTCAAGIGVGLALAAGVSRMRPAWLALPLYLVLLVASLLAAAWPIYDGPAIFAHHLVAGYFPGAIYDRAFHLPEAALWHRALALLAALAILEALRAQVGGRRWVAWALLALLVPAEALGPLAGFRVSQPDLEQRLPATLQHAGLSLHYHPERVHPRDLERMWDDVRFRYDRVRRALGAQAPPVRLWLFGTQQQRWEAMGSRAVDVTKPWLAGVYLAADGWDACTVEHEAWHAALAGSTSGWLGVPWHGHLPSMGLVEGMAEGLGRCAGRYSAHWKARVMLRQGELPDPQSLMDPTRFWTLPGRRAYSAAASFVAWLGESAGTRALLDAYRDGDLPRALGKPMSALTAEWRDFLATRVTLTPEEESLLAEYLSQKSIFEETCSVETARLEETLGPGLAADRWASVLGTLDRLEGLGAERSHLLLRVRALVRSGQRAPALALVEQDLAADPPFPRSYWLKLARADLLMLEGRVPEALRAYNGLADEVRDPDLNRNVRFRLLAFAPPYLPAERLDPLLLFPDGRADLRRELSSRLQASWPDDPRANYLWARSLASGARWDQAAPVLARLAAAPGDLAQAPAFLKEIRRLRGQAQYWTGDLDGAEETWKSLLEEAESPRERELPEEWLERIEFRRGW
jgi:tetratricopeptide (TPR) repeat protein